MKYHPPKFWQQSNHILGYLLFPLSLIYRLLIFIRWLLYKHNIIPVTSFKVPIIVVGNITVGGTGKTPLVIWLANFLKNNGCRPGIVSRGYGGSCDNYPILVNTASDVNIVGDEALLIAKRTNCPMVIAPNRPQAVHKLLQDYNCDIVISDDGLQHYGLARTYEIVVIDGKRQFGNGFCLPAGPLREPISRLKEANFIIVNEQITLSSPHLSPSSPRTRGSRECCKPLPGLDSRLRGNDVNIGLEAIHHMQMQAQQLYNLLAADLTMTLTELSGKTVHAVAGIGNPANFFALLREFKLKVIEHPFPDHYIFQQQDLSFADDLMILLTEKDAVKCQHIANDKCWCLPITAVISEQLQQTLLDTILNKGV